MANIRFQVKGKGICNLSVRFYNSNEFRCQSSTGLFVSAELWSAKTQRVKPSANFDSIALQSQLDSLKAFVLGKFNTDYPAGVSIDSLWLKKVIAEFHHKDMKKVDNQHKTYFCAFVRNYIEECKNRVNLTTGKPLAHSTLLKYKNVLDRLKEYEQQSGIKLKHSQIDTAFYKSFASFLSLTGNYHNSTIKKFLSIMRTICKEAHLQGVSMPPASMHKINISSQVVDVPYLNEKEIQAIFDLVLNDDTLELVRDWFIIQLWTRLRISDLRKLSSSNILEDTIEVIATQKTGAVAKIPIHPMVQVILDKYNGLPPKLCSSPTYNQKIKVLCKLAGIDKPMIGAKINPDTKRKEKGFYPKYELISSHCS